MKKLIGIGIGVALLYSLYGGEGIGIGSSFAVPQQAQAREGKEGVEQIEFMTLFDQKQPFIALATDQHYTVVEVYINTCSICKHLETGFPHFLKLRQDVLIKKVHFPESGMNFTITSRQEAEELQSRIESYQVCGTPHIEIYGPEQQLLAADNCGRKEGLTFLRRWISAETGISRGNL